MFTLCTFFVSLYHKICNTQNFVLLDIIHIEHSRQLRRAILADGKPNISYLCSTAKQDVSVFEML